MSGVYWGASRDSQYSEMRRGIGASGGIGCLLGGVGTIWGVKGVSGHVRGVRGVLGLAQTLGTQGPEGV